MHCAAVLKQLQQPGATNARRVYWEHRARQAQAHDSVGVPVTPHDYAKVDPPKLPCELTFDCKLSINGQLAPDVYPGVRLVMRGKQSLKYAYLAGIPWSSVPLPTELLPKQKHMRWADDCQVVYELTYDVDVRLVVGAGIIGLQGGGADVMGPVAGAGEGAPDTAGSSGGDPCDHAHIAADVAWAEDGEVSWGMHLCVFKLNMAGHVTPATLCCDCRTGRCLRQTCEMSGPWQ